MSFATETNFKERMSQQGHAGPQSPVQVAADEGCEHEACKPLCEPSQPSLPMRIPHRACDLDPKTYSRSLSHRERSNHAHLAGAFPDEAVRERDQAAAAAAVVRFTAKQSRESADYSNYCCFRERGICQAIQEHRPCTDFNSDVMVLELHSLFRRHAIEPSDELVSDMLKWQTRATQTSARQSSRSISDHNA